MTTLRKAAQQALEALERAGEELRWQAIGQVQRDLRTALAAEPTVKDSLTAEEALRRDAERYRWLRDQETHAGCVIVMQNRYFKPGISNAENIDKFVDEAMRHPALQGETAIRKRGEKT